MQNQFEDYIVSTIGRTDKQKQEAVRNLVRTFGGTPDTTEQMIAEMQNAMGQWKHMMTSFVGLVRMGTAGMVQQALEQGAPDPTKPSSHASHGDRVWPITEAARRGDPVIMAALLKHPGMTPAVWDVETSGGCGIGSCRKVSPLAEAILGQHKDVALQIIGAHPSLYTDVGLQQTSTFEGDQLKTCSELAEEWGDEQIIAALKAKLP